MPPNASYPAETLLELIRARNEPIVEELVREHSPNLLRAAYGLGFQGDSAAELVQRTWCTFVERAPEFEGRSQVRTFLFGILYNKARELRRQEKRIDNPDPIEPFVEERFGEDGHWIRAPINPERFALAAETVGNIQECLDQLPVSQRAAFWMREVDEAPSEEICQALEVSVSNLGVLLFRARNRLRECLEGKV